ncbi:pilus assembly PilX family protein [Halomonas mongoliensis]|uniref:pilus assembly PilX family protein n=1 Tax=Halomonas mongoliensis TaxID=321265 RepID=UPI00403AC7C3
MNNQKGAALIVVLSLLTVSLMVGLSSIQSSQIDERLAGNYRAQSQVQMGAEEAVSEGWSYLTTSADLSQAFSAASISLDEELGWDEFSDNGNFSGGGWLSGKCEDVDCYYRLVQSGSGYYILSMGTLGAGGLAVSSPVVVEINVERWSGFGPPSAVTLPGGIDENIPNNALQWPTSSKSRISGGDGFLDADGNSVDVAAMSVLQGEGLLKIESAYEEKAGLTSDTVMSLDNEPFEFVSIIKSMYEKYKNSPSGNYPGVNFYIGDDQMDFTGNHSLSGLHIVLNGSVQIGGNSHLDGALIVINVDDLDAEGAWSLSPATFVKLNGGGGDGTVWFNAENVSDALKPFGLTLDEFYGVSAEDKFLEGVEGVLGWR